MSTAIIVFAMVVVFLLYWIGSNVHAIAKRGEPAGDPDERPLTWREHMILNKRPDHSGATEDEWLKWHEKYKDKIDTKYFMRIDSIGPRVCGFRMLWRIRLNRSGSIGSKICRRRIGA